MRKNYKDDVPRIGDVYLINFDGSGSEQNGWRPGVIFQNNTGNNHSPNVIALPMTSSLKKLSQPTHVLVSSNEAGLIRDSVVLCENPECVSKTKMGKYLTTLSDEYMQKITEANLIATGAIAFLDIETITTIQHRVALMNRNIPS